MFTSLLKLICCIERPTKGLIEVAGQDLSRLNAKSIQKLRQNIGVAYQDFKLLPQRTVFQNIAVPMEVTYQPQRAIKKRVELLIEMLNLSDKRNKCIADEPTGNLDNATSKLVMNLFHHLNQNGTTIMIATHDEGIYRDNVHRVLDLSHGHLAPAVAREP